MCSPTFCSRPGLAPIYAYNSIQHWQVAMVPLTTMLHHILLQKDPRMAVGLSATLGVDERACTRFCVASPSVRPFQHGPYEVILTMGARQAWAVLGGASWVIMFGNFVAIEMWKQGNLQLSCCSACVKICHVSVCFSFGGGLSCVVFMSKGLHGKTHQAE